MCAPHEKDSQRWKSVITNHKKILFFSGKLGLSSKYKCNIKNITLIFLKIKSSICNKIWLVENWFWFRNNFYTNYFNPSPVYNACFNECIASKNWTTINYSVQIWSPENKDISEIDVSPLFSYFLNDMEAKLVQKSRDILEENLEKEISSLTITDCEQDQEKTQCRHPTCPPEISDIPRLLLVNWRN